MSRILFIDGDYLFRRHLHGSNRLLTTKSGKPSGVVFGALSSLFNLMQHFEPKRVFISVSSGKCKWREKLFPLYKFKSDEDRKRWTEPKDGEELSSAEIYYPQFNYLVQNLKHLGCHIMQLDSFEADDTALRTAIRYSTLPRDQVVPILVSDDWDWAQAVEYGVEVYRPIKQMLLNQENFKDVTNFSPENYKYFKTIKGDSSDNIPSVARGLGEKGILKMFTEIEKSGKIVDLASIKEYATLNKGKKMFSNLLKDWDQYLLNLKLSAPEYLNFSTLDDYITEVTSQSLSFSKQGVEQIFEDFEIQSLQKIILYPHFKLLS